MKQILISILFMAFLAGCKKYHELRDVNDLKSNGLIYGRLFLTDTLTRNLMDVPQSGKRITIQYAQIRDTVNFLYETTTNADGYFLFSNLRKDSTYIVRFNEKIDNINYFAVDIEPRKPTYDSVLLIATPNQTNQTGMIYTVRLNGTPVKGATVCLFNNEILFQGGNCEGALFTQTSSEFGKVSFMGLPDQTYYARISFTPNGISYRATDTQVIAEKGVAIKNIDLQLSPTPDLRQFVVVDEFNGILNNASVCLFNSNIYLSVDTCAGSSYSTSSNQKGIASFSNLPEGTLYLYAEWKSGNIHLKARQPVQIPGAAVPDTIRLR